MSFVPHFKLPGGALHLPAAGLRAALSWLIYPLGLLACLGLHLQLKAVLPLYWSTQLPLLLALIAITAMEFVLPYRRDWRPRRAEFGADLSFMLTVQVLLPRLLGVFFTLTLLGQGTFALWSGLWPHDWHLFAQVGLMLLLGEFGRYWLHRWCHTLPWLWRFHAVHHAPGILYANNVSRFHPVDKALQYLIDTLPFLLLGVNTEVFALYYVFYAVTGFFQHCNLEIRLGWLNHLISGPELHRWHHSRLLEEANSNYGNKLIVWDSLFGTRYQPQNREVAEIGLLERDYPQGFFAQLKAPFKDCGQSLLNALLALKMKSLGRRTRALRQLAQHPARVQEQVLLEILRANAGTAFGRQYGFASIGSVAEFQRRVPVQDYESLRPYIEQQMRGEKALTATDPVMYNATSGTTGAPKYVPVLPATLADLQLTQNIYASIAYAARPGAFAGKLLGIVSPAIEGRLPGGQPFGSASGHIYDTMPALARAKYVLPPAVFALEDYELKYYLILRLALAERELTYIGSANPSTFKKLLEVLDSEKESLLQDIATGGCRHFEKLPPALQKALRLKPLPARAQELRTLFENTACPDLGQIWPQLQLISTWTGGSCRIALDSLRARIPEQVLVMELGYLSSEFRGTITFDAANGLALPTLHSHFFEFVETDKWEQEIHDFLTLDQLETGRCYYLFVTAANGLYRYRMNDIVKVTGSIGNTPALAFMQKGKGVTSITGEKLCESQLIDAVAEVCASLGLQPAHYFALADQQQSLYRLYIEAALNDPERLARAVERQLCLINPEYRAKRASGRLQPLQALALRSGFYEAYKADCLRKGQREGQFKIVALQYQDDFTFTLTSWIEARQEAACDCAA